MHGLAGSCAYNLLVENASELESHHRHIVRLFMSLLGDYNLNKRKLSIIRLKSVIVAELLINFLEITKSALDK